MRSSSTYVTAPIGEGGEAAALKACRAEAVKRLGGKGLKCLSSARVGDDIAATFVREWDEPEPAPPDSD